MRSMPDGEGPGDEDSAALSGVDRRRFSLWLAGGVATLSLAGGSTARAADGPGFAPDIQAIKSRGKLLVGMTDFDSAPFYFSVDDRKAGPGVGPQSGWDVQLALDLAQALGVELVIVRQANAFNAVVDQVATGSVDVGISKLSVTPKRAVSVLFSHPTIELKHALLANRVSLARRVDDEDIKTILNRHFDGSVGVIAKSAYADTARQVMPQAHLREYPTWEAVVGAVERGDVDLAYRDELEIKKLMRLQPDYHLSLRSILITDIRDSIAAAVHPQSAQLLSIINIIIAQRQTFDANQLLDRYDEIFRNA